MRGVWLVLAAGMLVGVLGVGCANPHYRSAVRTRTATPEAPLVRPVVAVTDFENRANFSGQWNLGDGMAEIMIEHLMNSGRVTVLELQQTDGVLADIVRQGRDLFRREGRVERGRLKNARYLIRGVVTDFTVTSDASGWFGGTEVSGGLRGARTRVGLYVTVSDVETGQIVSAVRTEGAVPERRVRGDINYSALSFGGDAYFRTPLGRATQMAMDRAVARILADLPQERWEPRVAEGGVDGIIVNGGENVGLRVGQRFVVREEGRRITDPVTGDVIERLPGRMVGTLEIMSVYPAASHAALLDGRAKRGDFLEFQ